MPHLDADLLGRILSGPAGPGTTAVRLFRPQEAGEPAASAAVTETATTAEGGAPAKGDAPAAAAKTGSSVTVPELYCPQAVRDDPALGRLVNDRLVAWADEMGLFQGRLERLRSHDFGRLFMLAHPDTDDPDRLLAAARCGLAEWAVKEIHEAEEPYTRPELIGNRVALAHAVVDPIRLPARYIPQFEEVVAREPVLRGFRSALAHLGEIASPTQVARLRHELAVMFVGYGQEAEWRMSERRPAVWEYLLHRYENAFFPCMVLVDPVGGYELPAHEFADHRVRRTYLYAGVANVLLNDLYSMAKEDPTDTNLPNLIAAEEGCTLQEAVDQAAQIHDELMHIVEAESAALSALGSPHLKRFLDGVWAWMGGSHTWHRTSARYNTTT